MLISCLDHSGSTGEPSEVQGRFMLGSFLCQGPGGQSGEDSGHPGCLMLWALQLSLWGGENAQLGSLTSLVNMLFWMGPYLSPWFIFPLWAYVLIWKMWIIKPLSGLLCGLKEMMWEAQNRPLKMFIPPRARSKQTFKKKFCLAVECIAIFLP